MQLPLEIALDLKKYEKFENDAELLEELKNHPDDLISFFLYACEDETWAESHSTFMHGLLNWLTESNIQRNFPLDFFRPVIKPIQKHILLFQSLMPLDLLINVKEEGIYINSLMLSHQSHYFKRRILNECRGIKNPSIKVDDITLEHLQLINEFVMAGEVKDLWKFQPKELWAIIEVIKPFGFSGLIEACENVLRKYIDKENAFDMLIQAHRKFLQVLQNASVEFINPLELGIRLMITPVEFLGLEFFDYKERALESFYRLASDITHLKFSLDRANDSYFRTIINESPKLMALNLSETTNVDYLNEIPERVKELSLSRCVWISNQSMQILGNACPKVVKIDLSNNDQLTYAIWSELQRFKNLRELDLSRCFQIGDYELKIILQACPRLVELHLVDCPKITSEGFFEIGKRLPDLSVLNLSRTLISDAPLIDIMTRCKNLYSLDLTRCYGISDKAVLEGIKNCPPLKKIVVKNTSLSPDVIHQIHQKFP